MSDDEWADVLYDVVRDMLARLQRFADAGAIREEVIAVALHTSVLACLDCGCPIQLATEQMEAAYAREGAGRKKKQMAQYN